MKNHNIARQDGHVASSMCDVAEFINNDKTLTEADSGKVFFVTKEITVRLPKSLIGFEVTLINHGTIQAISITVDPGASQLIVGSIVTDSGTVYKSGNKGETVVNTYSSARIGDNIKLVANGLDGFFIKSTVGIWV